MKSFFKKIGKFLKKIWKAIRKVLAVILLIIAAILIIWACIATGGAVLCVVAGIEITTSVAMIIGAVCATGAFMIDSKTASKVVGKVGEAVGEAAGAIAGAAGDVAGGVIGGLLSSSGAIWLIGGLAAFMLLKPSNGSKGEEPKVEKISADKALKPSERDSFRDTPLDGEFRRLNTKAQLTN